MSDLTKDDVTEQLELMVDRNGLLFVLTGLVLVCEEKAAHIRHNWQDQVTAKAWDGDAKQIEKILERILN